MNDDRVFFGTILAMIALFCGNPGWAFLIFLIAIL